MKAIKIALLGTAALAAASVSARADQLSDMKAQIEALQASVAGLQANTDIPAGYQMVSFTRGANGEHVISIMPTADMPAATTVSWTGWVKAGVGTAYAGNGAFFDAAKKIQYATDVRAQAEVVAHAKTDTAVGEIGATIALETSGQTSTVGGWNGGNAGGVTTDGFSGYWKMTPNVTLTGGIIANLSKSSYSWDGVAKNDMWGATGGPILATNNGNPGDPAAIQLAYADGPIWFAVQLEDGPNVANVSAFGGSAKIGYKGDTVAMDVGAGAWSDAAGNTAYAVSAGAKASMGMFAIGAAIGTGTDFTGAASTPGSIWVSANLSDTANIQVGVTHEFAGAANPTTFGAGIYYDPVAQLEIGLEGGYKTVNAGGVGDGAYSAGLVTVYKF